MNKKVVAVRMAETFFKQCSVRGAIKEDLCHIRAYFFVHLCLREKIPFSLVVLVNSSGDHLDNGQNQFRGHVATVIESGNDRLVLDPLFQSYSKPDPIPFEKWKRLASDHFEDSRKETLMVGILSKSSSTVQGVLPNPLPPDSVGNGFFCQIKKALELLPDFDALVLRLSPTVMFHSRKKYSFFRE